MARERRRPSVSVRLIGDRIFNLATLGLAVLILAVLFGLALSLVLSSSPSISKFGWRFLISTDWDPATDVYGALPFIYGTVVSSALALWSRCR
jgi:phosphate transport system permease protein